MVWRVDGHHRNLLAVGVLSLFIFIVLTFIFVFHLYLENKLVTPLLSPFAKYYVEFFLLTASLGFGVGTVTFYLMSSKVEKVKEVAKVNTEMMLSFFQPEERIVVNYLLNGNGQARQYDLARLEGLDKVKAHRILRRMKQRRLIEIVRVGKVNTVTLRREIREAFA